MLHALNKIMKDVNAESASIKITSNENDEISLAVSIVPCKVSDVSKLNVNASKLLGALQRPIFIKGKADELDVILNDKLLEWSESFVPASIKLHSLMESKKQVAKASANIKPKNNKISNNITNNINEQPIQPVVKTIVEETHIEKIEDAASDLLTFLEE
jgi:hypothetical protein